MNSTGGAVGQIYIDDGVSVNPNSTRMVTLTVSNNTLSASSVGEYDVAQSLANVTFLGAFRPQNIQFSEGAVNWTWANNTLLVTGFGNQSAWNNNWTLSLGY